MALSGEPETKEPNQWQAIDWSYWKRRCEAARADRDTWKQRTEEIERDGEALYQWIAGLPWLQYVIPGERFFVERKEAMGLMLRWRSWFRAALSKQESAQDENDCPDCEAHDNWFEFCERHAPIKRAMHVEHDANCEQQCLTDLEADRDTWKARYEAAIETANTLRDEAEELEGLVARMQAVNLQLFRAR